MKIDPSLGTKSIQHDLDLLGLEGLPDYTHPWKQLAVAWAKTSLEGRRYLFFNSATRCLELHSLNSISSVFRSVAMNLGAESPVLVCAKATLNALVVMSKSFSNAIFYFDQRLNEEKYQPILLKCQQIWKNVMRKWIDDNRLKLSKCPCPDQSIEEAKAHIVLFAQNQQDNQLLSELEQACLNKESQISSYDEPAYSENSIRLSPRSIASVPESIKIKWPSQLPLTLKNVEEIEIKQIDDLQSLLKLLKISAPTLKSIKFNTSFDTFVLVPFELARAIIELPELEVLELGRSIWPLSPSEIPRCLIQISREQLSLFTQKESFPTESTTSEVAFKRRKLDVKYLGPSLILLRPFEQGSKKREYFRVPLGYFRRLSRSLEEHLVSFSTRSAAADYIMYTPTDEDYTSLYFLLRFGYENISIPEAYISKCLLAAQAWEMISLIDKILKAYPQYVFHPSIRQDHANIRSQLPPYCSNFDNHLPDMHLIWSKRGLEGGESEKQIDVDRFLLGSNDQSSRAELLRLVPLNAKVNIEEAFPGIKVDDSPITFDHFYGYFTNTIKLNLENIEGYWSLALAFEDYALIHAISRHLSENRHYFENVEASEVNHRRLGQWVNLAMNSGDTPLCQAILQEAEKISFQLLETKQGHDRARASS